MPKSKNRKGHKVAVEKRVKSKELANTKATEEYKASIQRFVEVKQAEANAGKKYVNQLRRSPGRQMFITPQKEG